MPIERTLAIIKPDGVMKGVEEKIKQRYLDAGLTIIRERLRIMSKSVARKLYQEHTDKFFFEGLVLSMSSDASITLELEGENAIQEVRTLNGATDPAEAAPGTIRHDFRSAGGPFNTVHASDSLEAAEREIAIAFDSKS